MKFLRFAGACLALVFAFVVPHAATAALTTSKEGLTVAVTWYDSLPWPDLREKPYVEIVSSQDPAGEQAAEILKMRGFLLAEDAESWTIFCDGTMHGGSVFQDGAWPFAAQRILKKPPNADDDEVLKGRPIDLAEAVAGLLAESRRPKDESEERRSLNRRMSSRRTALFVLARCCARQGRADLAGQLDEEVMSLKPEAPSDNEPENQPLRVSVEKEIAHALMWKAVVDCGETSLTRPELLTQFANVVRDFPASEHHDRAAGFVAMLQKMIAEDEAHARAVRPLEALTQEQQIQELIFRLRDQNGHQRSQPGTCDVFDDFGGLFPPRDSTATQLAKLGFAAVPPLIEALSDKRLSRSVGYKRSSFFSHFVLTVGDCAQAILARIAGREFWVAQTTTAAMQKDGQTVATRAAVEEWWRSVKDKGVKQMLIEGVRAGGHDSVEQATRLLTLDASAALPAMVAGIGAAEENWVRAELVRAIAGIPGPASTEVLRDEMKTCVSLHGRVTAAGELFRRGKPGTVPAMIAEWRKWRPPLLREMMTSEDVRPLITFLGTCGEMSGIEALRERFPELPVGTKDMILGTVTDTYPLLKYESVRDRKLPAIPAIEVAGENLAATALEDRRAKFGSSGNREHVRYFRDPRVCDFAAYALSERWPERYHFEWLPTRHERDALIFAMRNAWRSAHGREPLPVPVPRVHESAAREPNVISSLTWSGGAPLENLPIAEGQVLTADALVETLVLLHRKMPARVYGFDFTAERAGSGGGFVIEIAWGMRPGVSPGETYHAIGMWSFHTDVALGIDSLYNSTGGRSRENSVNASGYDEERRGLTRALAAKVDQAMTFCFSTRMGED